MYQSEKNQVTWTTVKIDGIKKVQSGSVVINKKVAVKGWTIYEGGELIGTEATLNDAKDQAYFKARWALEFYNPKENA